MSNSVSPPAEPGVYLNANYNVVTPLKISFISLTSNGFQLDLHLLFLDIRKCGSIVLPLDKVKENLIF
jgi:hypothetical protein